MSFRLWYLRLFRLFVNGRPNEGRLIMKPSAKASPKDERDRDYEFKASTAPEKSVSLLAYAPVKSQGSIGSCVPHAILSAMEILMKRDHPERFIELSELSLYYHCRVDGGSFPKDSGLVVRDALRRVLHRGAVPEVFWPYDVSKYNAEPRGDGWGRFWKIKSYHRVWNVADLKVAILEGNPVVFAHDFWKGLKGDEDGFFEGPVQDIQRGGHAQVIIGYDSESNYFTVLNSWGRSFGMNGVSYWSEETLRSVFIEAWIITI